MVVASNRHYLAKGNNEDTTGPLTMDSNYFQYVYKEAICAINGY